jgi:hypothetical protein
MLEHDHDAWRTLLLVEGWRSVSGKRGSGTVDRKICCVGFQRTGTTSLRGALNRLGLSVGQVTKQINEVLDPSAPNAREVITDIAISHLATRDAIQDSPSAFIYKEYDRAFPGSKFILTKRSTGSWIRSMSTFFPDQTSPLRRWMYGVDRISGNEDLICEIYDRGNQEIRDYFRDRPEDFMEMDITSGDGWFELVNFLGRDMLPPFPHANASVEKRKQR